MKIPIKRICALIAIVLQLALTGDSAWSQQPDKTSAESLFHQGYYLQHHELDTAGALALYEQALAANPDADIIDHIRQQMLAIKADVAASDFARLMPADSLAYFEITDPAEHLEQLLALVGVAGDSQPSRTVTTIPLDDGFVLPSNFKVDPDVLSCFKSAKGLGIAVTGMNQRGEPKFLLALHPGRGNPIRGLLKTALQVVPKTETAGGYPTYCHQDKIWLVETPTLILVSPHKQLVDAAIRRMTEPQGSLASLASFQSAREARQDSFAFAFVDGSNTIKAVSAHLHGDANIPRVLLDLDHVTRATAALGTTESGIEAEISVAFDDDHHSLAYNLIRTAPVSGATLNLVPNDALFVATLGINPTMPAAAAGEAPRNGFSMLDLGRELFANIEEVSLFAIPQLTDGNNPIPEFGLIVASSNPQQSENLWRQLLSLPSRLDPRPESQATEITIHGQTAWRYRFAEKDAPEVTLTRLSERAMIVGTAKTVDSMLAAKPAAEARGAFAGRLKQLPDHVSKAAFVNMGQALKLAGQVAPPSEREQLLRISELCRDTRLTLTSDEAPAAWSISINAVGIPKVRDVVTAVAESLGEKRATTSVNSQR